MRRRRK